MSFYKKVDKRSRKSMIQFLTNHFRYNTMNSWNKSTSYANNVKLQNLSIPEDCIDLAYDILSGEVSCPDWDESLSNLLHVFRETNGYHVGFNGRSNGYLVLYHAQKKPNNDFAIQIGKSMDMDEDFSDWTMSELKERTILVQNFDKLCDELEQVFVHILKTYTVKTSTQTITNIKKTLVSKTSTDD